MSRLKDRTFIHSERSLYSNETKPPSGVNEGFVFLWFKLHLCATALSYDKEAKYGIGSTGANDSLHPCLKSGKKYDNPLPTSHL